MVYWPAHGGGGDDDDIVVSHNGGRIVWPNSNAKSSGGRMQLIKYVCAIQQCENAWQFDGCAMGARKKNENNFCVRRKTKRKMRKTEITWTQWNAIDCQFTMYQCFGCL